MVSFEAAAPLPKITGLYAKSFDRAATLVAFVSAVDCPDFETVDDAAIAKWAHDRYAAALPRRAGYEGALPKPSSGFGTRWIRDPFSRGSYSYIPIAQAGKLGADEAPSPLDLLELGRPLWSGRLGFAGEATSAEHYSYAHGAFLTGQREAIRIANELDAADEEA